MKGGGGLEKVISYTKKSSAAFQQLTLGVYKLKRFHIAFII